MEDHDLAGGIKLLQSRYVYSCRASAEERREYRRTSQFLRRGKRRDGRRRALPPPRRRPSRRSSPRRWLLIFELVQNFHNTATAADARGYAEYVGRVAVGGKEERREDRNRETERRRVKVGEHGARKGGERERKRESRHRPRTVSNLAKFRRLKRDTPRARFSVCPFGLRHPSVTHPPSGCISPSSSIPLPTFSQFAFLRGFSLAVRLTLGSLSHPFLCLSAHLLCPFLPLFRLYRWQRKYYSRNDDDDNDVNDRSTTCSVLCYIAVTT